MSRFRDKIMTIGFISSLSIFFIAIAAIIFLIIFCIQNAEFRSRLVLNEFDKQMLIKAKEVENEVSQAKENLQRIYGYISVLDLMEPEKALPYLRKIMAENIQFEENEYNVYFALEKDLAEKYFKEKSFVFTVHKDRKKKNTKEYGKPEDAIAKPWTDTDYLTNPKEIWYHVAKKGKGFQVAPPYQDNTYLEGAWLLTVSKGLYDNDKFEGMVGVDILLDGVLDNIENTRILGGGGIFIVNQRGIVTTKAATPEARGFLNVSERFKYNLFSSQKGKDLWGPIVNTNMSGIQIKGADGRDYLVSSKKLATAPATLIAYHRLGELEKPLYISIAVFASVSLVLLGFAVLTYRFLSRNVNKPIMNLVKVMGEVKDANVSGVSAPVVGTVEIKALGEIFNKMMDRIADAVKEKEEYYTKLEEMNVTLEQKVDDRTKELTSKNHELEDTLTKLEETQAQLVAKEKLASLGALTAGVAHEIKNPLNFVNNFAFLSVDLVNEIKEKIEAKKELMNETECEDIEETLATLEQNMLKIKEHGTRADNIVKNMLLHSRGRTGEFQLTEFNPLVEEYVNLAYHGMRATDSTFNVEIIKDLDVTIGKVNVVTQDFGRVILNIANNAFYAVNEKKKALGGSFSPLLSISTRNLGDSAELRIRDNGNGIHQSILDKIFNPFFTTKPPGVNTGLGLSISFDIVAREHKGEIKVDTKEGEYTEFIVTIPREKS